MTSVSMDTNMNMSTSVRTMRSINIKTKNRDRIWKGAMMLSAAAACGVLVWILGFVLIQGLPKLTFNFLGSLAPQLLSTLLLVLGTLTLALPIGVGAAIYLNEYARKGRLVSAIRFSIQCLSSIPSIVYGLFGMALIGTGLKLGFSIATCMLTLSVMVLPTIITATEQALMDVPMSLREGAWALGAGKLRTTMSVVLPSALPGVSAAAVLSVGRIVGETAAVYLTMGTMLKAPTGFLSSGRTLSVHLYLLAKEAIGADAFAEGYATAALLMFVVLLINFSVKLFDNGSSDARKTKRARRRTRTGVQIPARPMQEGGVHS